MPPQITGGELDNDPDNDANPNDLLKKPQGYVGDQSSLVAAITAELTSKGVAIENINANLPTIEAVANGLLGIFAPGTAPAAQAVENIIFPNGKLPGKL